MPDEIRQVAEVPRTLSGKLLEVPVKRILMGADPAKAASRESLANPSALDWFVELRPRVPMNDDRVSFAGEGLSAELLPVEELADCAATALGADGEADPLLRHRRRLHAAPRGDRRALRGAPAPRADHERLAAGLRAARRGACRRQRRGGRVPRLRPRAEAPVLGRATLLYADWHDDGISLDMLGEHVRMSQVPPTFSLWSPTFHNPTGLTLTHEERWDIGRLMLQSGITMVEDDTYGPLRFEGEPVPTMFRIFGQRPIYSASLSTIVAPGLRVGVWIVPDELSGELATRANDLYISPALLGQATVFELMQRGATTRTSSSSPPGCASGATCSSPRSRSTCRRPTWTRPEGGIFLLLRLPPGTDARAVLDAAEGVEATGGAEFMGLPNSIRLNYGAPALDEIEEGVERSLAPSTGTRVPAGARVAGVGHPTNNGRRGRHAKVSDTSPTSVLDARKIPEMQCFSKCRRLTWAVDRRVARRCRSPREPGLRSRRARARSRAAGSRRCPRRS